MAGRFPEMLHCVGTHLLTLPFNYLIVSVEHREHVLVKFSDFTFAQLFMVTTSISLNCLRCLPGIVRYIIDCYTFSLNTVCICALYDSKKNHSFILKC